MTQDERDLRADLIELATNHTNDPLGALVSMLGATLTMADVLVEHGIPRGAVRHVIDRAFPSHAN